MQILMGQFEQASAAYAAANDIERDADWFVLKMQEELGELTQVWNRISGRARRKGMTTEEMARALADETVDILGHVLLFARHNNLDLASAIERKWRFRPDWAGISDEVTQ